MSSVADLAVAADYDRKVDPEFGDREHDAAVSLKEDDRRVRIGDLRLSANAQGCPQTTRQ